MTSKLWSDDEDTSDDGKAVAGAWGRLDHLAIARCGPPDPALFAPVEGRYLVLFEGPPSDDQLAAVGAMSRVRWLYRQLGLAEVETSDAPAVAAVPGVYGMQVAEANVASTRGLAVGLNMICAFAAYQAREPEAFYRHRTEIGYPIITTRDGKRELDVDPELQLPTPPAIIPVINMSVGTTAVPYPTTNDLVNLATACASGQALVVVAAGNCGARDTDSLSAWARPEWVLSVAASDDEEGTRIAPYSSRGGAGPDVVAWGASGLDPEKRGTSFAAPRVSGLARLVVAAFCELGREVMVAQGQSPMGVPAVGAGFVDDFADEIWWQPPEMIEFQALPLVGVDVEEVARLVEATGQAFTVRTTPAIMREILVSAARAMPGMPAAEAGAGFLDRTAVVDRLAAMTAAELWGWFGSGANAPAGLDGIRPFDAAGLVALDSVVRMTGPMVKFDYRVGRWAVVPQPDAMRESQDPRGIPVDLTGYRL